MKKNGFFTKKMILVILMVMGVIIPNLSVYSAVGSYTANSSQIKASNYYEAGNSLEKEANIAALARAVHSAYSAGKALGFIAHHLYHFAEGHPQQVVVEDGYKSNDFSNFDN